MHYTIQYPGVQAEEAQRSRSGGEGGFGNKFYGPMSREEPCDDIGKRSPYVKNKKVKKSASTNKRSHSSKAKKQKRRHEAAQRVH